VIAPLRETKIHTFNQQRRLLYKHSGFGQIVQSPELPIKSLPHKCQLLSNANI